MKKIVCAILMAALMCASAVAEWDWPGLWIANHCVENEQMVIMLKLNEDGTASMQGTYLIDGLIQNGYKYENGHYSHAYNTAYVFFDDISTVSMVISENGNCYGLVYIGDTRLGIYQFIKVPKTQYAP